MNIYETNLARQTNPNPYIILIYLYVCYLIIYQF